MDLNDEDLLDYAKKLSIGDGDGGGGGRRSEGSTAALAILLDDSSSGDDDGDNDGNGDNNDNDDDDDDDEVVFCGIKKSEENPHENNNNDGNNGSPNSQQPVCDRVPSAQKLIKKQQDDGNGETIAAPQSVLSAPASMTTAEAKSATTPPAATAAKPTPSTQKQRQNDDDNDDSDSCCMIVDDPQTTLKFTTNDSASNNNNNDSQQKKLPAMPRINNETMAPKQEEQQVNNTLDGDCGIADASKNSNQSTRNENNAQQPGQNIAQVQPKEESIILDDSSVDESVNSNNISIIDLLESSSDNDDEDDDDNADDDNDNDAAQAVDTQPANSPTSHSNDDSCDSSKNPGPKEGIINDNNPDTENDTTNLPKNNIDTSEQEKEPPVITADTAAAIATVPTPTTTTTITTAVTAAATTATTTTTMPPPAAVAVTETTITTQTSAATAPPPPPPPLTTTKTATTASTETMATPKITTATITGAAKPATDEVSDSAAATMSTTATTTVAEHQHYINPQRASSTADPPSFKIVLPSVPPVQPPVAEAKPRKLTARKSTEPRIRNAPQVASRQIHATRKINDTQTSVIPPFDSSQSTRTEHLSNNLSNNLSNSSRKEVRNDTQDPVSPRLNDAPSSQLQSSPLSQKQAGQKRNIDSLSNPLAAQGKSYAHSPLQQTYNQNNFLPSQQSTDNIDVMLPKSRFRPQAPRYGVGNDDASAATFDSGCQSRGEISHEESDDDSEQGSMTKIKHLTTTIICPKTGLPIHKFSVFGAPDDIIYDFQVEAAPSSIPNAGYGAFLTFLGARRLTPYHSLRARKILKHRSYIPAKTMEKLTAEIPGGYMMGLTLTGHNLHGNFNNPYVPISKMKLTARPPSMNSTMKIKLAGEDVHFDDDEIQALRDNANGQERFGFLGIHLEEHYQPAPNLTFTTTHKNCALIDLGRYGPFRREDRKIISDFDVKSFIFSQEPGEWCFGVNEDIYGHSQIIDITDDATGEPHQIAKENICMYVNEVGHSNLYKQNVYALQDEDERTVHYYLDIVEPMKQGDKVELLVDYKKEYERVRERKGYGIKNLTRGLKSDGDLSSKLKRNFSDRKEMLATVSHLTIGEALLMLRWIDDEIRTPLVHEMNKFLREYFNATPSTFNASYSPSAQQCVALRRIEWLGELFEEHLENLESEMNDKEQTTSFQSFLLKECRTLVKQMSWQSAPQFVDLLLVADDWVDSKGKRVVEVIRHEMIEEACYDNLQRLKKPLEPSVWCSEAQRLTMALCELHAQKTWATKGALTDATKEALSREFLTEANISARVIRSAVSNKKFTDLSFENGVDGEVCVKTYQHSTFSGFKPSSTLLSSNVTNPKGPTAALLDFTPYMDAVALGMDICIDPSKFSMPVANELIISKQPAPPSPAEVSDSSTVAAQSLTCLPRSLESWKNGACEVDTEWYLIWQVIFVVDTFAKYCLSDASYNFEDLCDVCNVNVEKARHAAQQGILKYDGYDARIIRKNKKIIEPKKKQRNIPKKSVKKTAQKSTSLTRKQSSKQLAAKKAAKKTAKNQTTQKQASKPRKGVTNATLFWKIVWVALRKIGWELERGSRPTDWYMLPPGVKRGKGFKPRVDFFDSILLLFQFLRNDARWKDNPEIQHSLKLYDACFDLMKRLRVTKRLPKFPDGDALVHYLVAQVQQDPSWKKNTIDNNISTAAVQEAHDLVV